MKDERAVSGQDEDAETCAREERRVEQGGLLRDLDEVTENEFETLRLSLGHVAILMENIFGTLALAGLHLEKGEARRSKGGAGGRTARSRNLMTTCSRGFSHWRLRREATVPRTSSAWAFWPSSRRSGKGKDEWKETSKLAQQKKRGSEQGLGGWITFRSLERVLSFHPLVGSMSSRIHFFEIDVAAEGMGVMGNEQVFGLAKPYRTHRSLNEKENSQSSIACAQGKEEIRRLAWSFPTLAFPSAGSHPIDGRIDL